MKRIVYIELMRRFQTSPKIKSKFKVFALLGIVFVLAISGVLIWAGVSAFRFAGHHLQSAEASSQIRAVEEQLAKMPMVTVANCWTKAQDLMNLGAWVTTPIATNLQDLKTACLENKSPCEPQKCNDPKMQNALESERTI